MGGKGGSADSSGMYEAMASADAAQQAYALGEQQLQWSQQVWNQEQPMIQQIVGSDVSAQTQQDQFAAEQEGLYQSTYQPLEQQYVGQVQQWASPQQQQLNASAAESNVNEAAESQRQASQEQLESYGINPGSTRFAGLDIGSRTMQAAAAAGAGTQSIQQTQLAGLGLESGAINTGRGLPNTTAALTSSGTGAGSAGAGASQSNLATGSTAQTAASNWYNTGAANMNTYVNAVNGYNQAQLGYAQVGAMQTMGLGALAGGILGNTNLINMLQAGGEVDDPNNYPQSTDPSGNSGAASATPGGPPTGYAIPPEATPGGHVPSSASPSGGQEVDDVPARLTAGEFVIPKDVVKNLGQQFFYNTIDKSRKQQEQAAQRNDIGGEQGTAPPMPPTFVSRPVLQPMASRPISPQQAQQIQPNPINQGIRTASVGIARNAIPRFAIPPRQVT